MIHRSCYRKYCTWSLSNTATTVLADLLKGDLAPLRVAILIFVALLGQYYRPWRGFKYCRDSPINSIHPLAGAPAFFCSFFFLHFLKYSFLHSIPLKSSCFFFMNFEIDDAKKSMGGVCYINLTQTVRLTPQKMF